jgi:hypothetical protein
LAAKSGDTLMVITPECRRCSRREWRDRMEALPTVQCFRAAQPSRGPIEHARKWATSHRPKY